MFTRSHAGLAVEALERLLRRSRGATSEPSFTETLYLAFEQFEKTLENGRLSEYETKITIS